jgi:hypothetical protein
MPDRPTLSSRPARVDRRRLIEAKVARDCELFRREIAMLRESGQAGARGLGAIRTRIS